MYKYILSNGRNNSRLTSKLLFQIETSELKGIVRSWENKVITVQQTEEERFTVFAVYKLVF